MESRAFPLQDQSQDTRFSSLLIDDRPSRTIKRKKNNKTNYNTNNSKTNIIIPSLRGPSSSGKTVSLYFCCSRRRETDGREKHDTIKGSSPHKARDRRDLTWTILRNIKLDKNSSTESETRSETIGNNPEVVNYPPSQRLHLPNQIHSNVKYLDRPEESVPADQILTVLGTSSNPIGYSEYQTHIVQAFQQADDQRRRRIDFAPEGHLSGNYRCSLGR
ncbi:hypothetical protein AFLA_008843 [Aspergillus flavus NRRL3357]|nr:hypothetical protein AFLA_008843 [Aspergillus flavus NRRL3357]